MNTPDKKIKIAVSSYLLGENVRYDGKNKNDPLVTEICSVFDCVSICPEAGARLGTPRPPLKLIKIDNQLRIRGRTNPRLDVTETIRKFVVSTVENNNDICGYIFKSRSPSCGVNSTPWFQGDNRKGGVTSGVFASQIGDLLPQLPVIEETELDDDEARQAFIKRVKAYYK